MDTCLRIMQLLDGDFLQKGLHFRGNGICPEGNSMCRVDTRKQAVHLAGA